MKTTSKSLAKNETKSVANDAFDMKKETKEVVSLHLSIVNKSKQAFELSVKLGEKLVAIKEKLPHGHFKKFIANNVKIVSIRTAQRYMQFYFKQDELREKLGDMIEINKATKYISSQSDKKKNNIETDIDDTLIEETQKTIDHDKHEKSKAVSRWKHDRALPTDKIILLEVFKERKQKKSDEVNRLQKNIEKDEMRIQKANLLIQKRIERIKRSKEEIEKLDLDYAKVEQL